MMIYINIRDPKISAILI